MKSHKRDQVLLAEAYAGINTNVLGKQQTASELKKAKMEVESVERDILEAAMNLAYNVCMYVVDSRDFNEFKANYFRNALKDNETADMLEAKLGRVSTTLRLNNLPTISSCLALINHIAFNRRGPVSKDDGKIVYDDLKKAMPDEMAVRRKFAEVSKQLIDPLKANY
jgi:hypothetical protein